MNAPFALEAPKVPRARIRRGGWSCGPVEGAKKRVLSAGKIFVRQATAHRAQFAIMDEVYTLEIAGEARKAVGHAKVQFLRWIDRSPEWLEAAHV